MNDLLEPPEDPHPKRATTSPTPRHREAANDAPALPKDPADTTEFEAFYQRSVPRLVAFLRWQGAAIPDAVDCVQETMIQAHMNWSTIAHHHAWCRRVASRFYARKLACLVKPIADPETEGWPLLTPNTDLDAFEQRHHILVLLEQLPLRQRQVMAWTYDGCEDTEIAEELKITLEAVRGSRKKARVKLRKLLAEAEESRP
jgi:RNA polymerase sigma factor (sigma-70 family)